MGTLLDVKIIDWQCVFIGSPVLDLSYCFYAGAAASYFDNLDRYLRMYHKSLSDTLKEYSLDAEQIYPFSTFKTEWKKFCKFGFYLGLMLWKAKLTDPNRISDCMENIEKDRTYIWKVDEHAAKQFKEIMKSLVLHMYKNNFLD